MDHGWADLRSDLAEQLASQRQADRDPPVVRESVEGPLNQSGDMEGDPVRSLGGAEVPTLRYESVLDFP